MEKWATDSLVGDDIRSLYELDVGDCDTKMLYKLTDCHIYREKMKKMKVKHAAQVFSQRVSSTLRGLANYGNGCLPRTAIDTADFVLFMDKLFDSVNGSIITGQYGKPLRCAVKKSSPHIEFWNEALNVLQSIKFIKQNGKQHVPPCVRNWISTIHGLIYIWKNFCSGKFDFLCPRNLNQDPVENFFGCIRSHGIRNVNPSSHSFINSFKTLIVNNFVSTHSPNANCEEDESEGSLSNLRNFIYTNVVSEQQIVDEDRDDNISISFSEEKSNLQIELQAYIAGYVSKVILRQIHSCAICRKELLTQETKKEHRLITNRAYGPKALLRPNTTFLNLYSKCVDITHYYLPKLCHENNLRKKLIGKINKHLTFQFTCTKHNLKDIFLEKFVIFYILTWVKNVNKILCGVDCRNINDDVKRLALEKYKKCKTRKTALINLKRTATNT